MNKFKVSNEARKMVEVLELTSPPYGKCFVVKSRRFITNKAEYIKVNAFSQKVLIFLIK